MFDVKAVLVYDKVVGGDIPAWKVTIDERDYYIKREHKKDYTPRGAKVTRTPEGRELHVIELAKPLASKEITLCQLFDEEGRAIVPDETWYTKDSKRIKDPDTGYEYTEEYDEEYDDDGYVDERYVDDDDEQTDDFIDRMSDQTWDQCYDD